MPATTATPPVRGRVRATGFVLEPELLGEPEARRRVLQTWCPGSRLLQLPDGGWLLLLPQPVDLRAERAPGLPVLPGPGGQPVVWRHGTALEPDAGSLPAVDVTGWLDLTALPVHGLEPLQQPEPEPLAPEPEAERITGLRDVVGVQADEEAAVRGGLLPARPGSGTGLSRPAGRRGWLRLAAILLLLVWVAAGVLRLLDTGAGPADRPQPSASASPTRPDPSVAPPDGGAGSLPPIPPGPLPGPGDTPATTGSGSGLPGVPLLIVIALIALVRLLPERVLPAGRSGPVRRVQGRPGAGRTWRRGWRGRARGGFPRLLVSPLGVLLRRRHERYLLGLTRAFQQGDFDTALRRAIALGGGGSGLTVRLPRPRLGALTPSASVGAGGPALASPLQVWEYLRALYGQAAEELEKAGRVEEAAFVRADLMRNPVDAVALLERHGRTLLAAELALGRDLDPALAIRLFWQAGRPDRALEVARIRGGLDEAARRLEQSDPAAAHELRAEWVTGLLRAGDVVGAVRAGWRYPALRPLIGPHLAGGVAAGGPSGALLLAHLVSSRPTDEGLAAAEALLGSAGEPLRAARATFVTTLAELEPEHPAADRRLASAAIRLLLVEPGLLGDHPPEVGARTVRVLRGRAGALLVADLPQVTVVRPPPRAQAWQVAALGEPGRRPVLDAVALPAGVLVALGGAGVRLLTADGRVRARWEQTAHRLVVADHGSSVLLLAQGERTRTLHRLDLAERRVRPWTHLSGVGVPDGFDGAVLPVLDADGLAFLDTTGPPGARPRTVWRELERGVRVLALERGATAMSALVQGAPVNTDLVPELWTWALPGLRLRTRVRRDVREGGPPVATALSAGGGMLTLHEGPSVPIRAQWHPATYGSTYSLEAEDLVGVAASGPHLALLRRSAEAMTLEVLAAMEGAAGAGRATEPFRPALQVAFPGAEALGLRHHADVVTVHDGTGRVVAADVRTGRVVANLTVKD